MFSKMSVIAFTAGLVATLCVNDVNAVVQERCTFTDSECKTMVEGSCLGGIAIPDNADYYATAQAGNEYYLGMSTEKTCKKYAKAQWKNAIAQNGESNDGDYTEESFLASLTEFSGCQPNADKDTEWFAVRCGASFTGSSMAAVFGLLSVALALW